MEDISRKQILDNQKIVEEIKKLKEDSNNWLNIDFEKLEKTPLEWNHDKTVGYKIAVADFHTRLDKILGETHEH